MSQGAHSATQPAGAAHVGEDPPLPGAKSPVSIGRVAGLGVLWSLLLIGLGAVAVRDALAHGDVVSGRPWSERALESLDDRTAPDWLVPAAVVCLVVALWLVYTALAPRPRKEAQVRADTGVFLTSTGLRRLAASTARETDGVDTATATATRTRVSITALTTPDRADAVRGAVSEAVTHRFSTLTRPPRVRVRVRTTGGHP